MHLKIVASSLLCFSYAVNSVSIAFTNNSPWTHGGLFRSEGSCSFSLDRTYAVREWIITITVDNPTSQIVIWDYFINGTTDNTYYLENKYSQATGPKLLTFHFDTSTYQPLTGFCISNADPQVLSSTPTTEKTTTNLPFSPDLTSDAHTAAVGYGHITISTDSATVETVTSEERYITRSTSTADHSALTLYTENVENSDLTSRAIYGGSTTYSLYCFQPNMVCSCIKLVNMTATSVQESVSNLKRDLRIDKKKTLLARSKKISAEDNRPAAKAIGGIGVLVLCVSIGTIVLSDAETLYNSVKSIKFVRKYGKRRKKRNDKTEKTQMNPSESKYTISDAVTNLINDSMSTTTQGYTGVLTRLWPLDSQTCSSEVFTTSYVYSECNNTFKDQPQGFPFNAMAFDGSTFIDVAVDVSTTKIKHYSFQGWFFFTTDTPSSLFHYRDSQGITETIVWINDMKSKVYRKVNSDVNSFIGSQQFSKYKWYYIALGVGEIGYVSLRIDGVKNVYGMLTNRNSKEMPGTLRIGGDFGETHANVEGRITCVGFHLNTRDVAVDVAKDVCNKTSWMRLCKQCSIKMSFCKSDNSQVKLNTCIKEDIDLDSQLTFLPTTTELSQQSASDWETDNASDRNNFNQPNKQQKLSNFKTSVKSSMG
ncbi:unnamed protein product [Mytilus coruscus]|uniref:Uncharacterized protein n=1 Tax=Mytilus coruscus TaxID=42192 RepID=A0A6J8DZB3_MYTCO|nr:unnamed protein product [Mytilus coruscus]